jgi:hypothetical protein
LATAQTEIGSILAQLEHFGWRIEQKKGHPVAFPPNGSLPPMTVTGSPSTRNWRRTLGADLRRRGFNLTGTTVIPLAATTVAATPTPKAATEPSPAPREDTPVVAAQPRSTQISESETPGPDDIVNIEPAPFGTDGFPGKTTDKVLKLTYGNGRVVHECAEEGCKVQKDKVHEVLYHRRVHSKKRALQVVHDQPVEQAAPVDAEARAEWGLGGDEPTLTPPVVTEAEEAVVEQAVEQVVEARERKAEAEAAYEVAGQVIDGQAVRTIEAYVAAETATPDASADIDELLAQARSIVTTFTALTSAVERLRESEAKALEALRRAEQHRDDAEGMLGEWRQRAHAAEGKLAQFSAILGGGVKNKADSAA